MDGSDHQQPEEEEEEGSCAAPQEVQNQQQHNQGFAATPTKKGARPNNSNNNKNGRSSALASWRQWLSVDNIALCAAPLPDDQEDEEAPPPTSTTTAPAYTTKYYRSVLWNGQLGNMALTSSHVVFEGLAAAGVSVQIPWHVVSHHYAIRSDAAKDAAANDETAVKPSARNSSTSSNRLSANRATVDIRLVLYNGQTVDLVFSEQQDLQLVHDELDLCILHQHLRQRQDHQQQQQQQLDHPPEQGNGSVVKKKDDDNNKFDSIMQDFADDVNLASSTQSSTYSTDEQQQQQQYHTNDNHDSHDERDPLILENKSLRESVGSLLSKIELLEERDNVQQSKVGELQSQFDTFRRSLVLETGRGATVRFAGLDDDLDDTLMNGNVESSSPTTRMLTTMGGDYNNNNGVVTNFHKRRSIFESTTEDGMDLIRRKLSFRKSTVTGQRAFAKTLPSDTYAFLMVAPTRSIPFVLGLLVVSIQVLTYTLMGFSIVAETAQQYNNSLGVPPNVDAAVRIVQLFAIIIAVVTQDDLMKGLDMIRFRKSKSFLEAFPRSSVAKVAFGIFARSIQGCFGLVVTFFLIVTSETIYYLLLNFTAVEFISKLDEAFFVLSRFGFAGRSCEVASKAVEDTTYYVHTKVYRKRKIALFACIFIGMIVGYSVIFAQQRNGEFLCKTLFVQMGDEMKPSLASFSGLYDQVPVSSANRFLHNDRVRYIDRDTRTAVFGYCEKDRYWTFNYVAANASEDSSLPLITSDEYDPCEESMVRSSRTGGYDIMEVATQDWIVKNGFSRQAFLQPFVMVCSDCSDQYNNCRGRGTCSFAVCECNEGSYGLQCEFHEPCKKLAVDSRSEGFLGTRPWSDNYHALEVDGDVVSVYHRPVYVSKSTTGPQVYDMMFFTGRRWSLTYTDKLHAYLSPDDTLGAEAALASFFKHEFHAHWTNYTLAFLSEPMDTFTPGNAQSPVGLQWYVASDKQEHQIQWADTNRPIEARLICSVCDIELNPCSFGGVCEEGACQCIQGSSGSNCELPPLGNGHCDASLNTPQYDLDAGDCCESTCISRKTSRDGYSCGRETTGYGYVGYYDCRLPPETWQKHTMNGLSREDGTLLGYSLALSRQGNFLAVGMPGVSKVVVFDRDGSKWTQRGKPLEGVPDTNFGRSVRISSGPDDLWNNPESAAPFVIAVGAPEEGNGTIHLYRCGTNPEEVDCTESPQRFDGYAVFDISDDGGTLALGESGTTSGLAGANESDLPKVHLVSIDEQTDPFVSRIIDAPFSDPPLFENNGTSEIGSLPHRTIQSISISRYAESIAIQSVAVDLNKWISCAIGSELQSDCDSSLYAVTNSVVGGDDEARIFMQGVVGYQSGDRPLLVSADGHVIAFASLNCTASLVNFFAVERGNIIRRPPLPKLPNEECNTDFFKSNMTMALSANGNTIAIGYKSSAYVYDFNGTMWHRVGSDDVTKEFTSGGSTTMTSVALSSADGSLAAVGMPSTSIAQGGIASVFSTPRRQSICRPDEQTLHLSFTTDAEPTTLSWTVYNNNTLVEEALPGRYSYQTATYVHAICLPKASCSIITFYDQLLRTTTETNEWYTPALNEPGSIDLLLEDTKEPVATGGFSGPMRRIFVGDDCLTCPPGTKLLRMMMRTCETVAWELVDHVGKKLFQGYKSYHPHFIFHGGERLNETISFYTPISTARANVTDIANTTTYQNQTDFWSLTNPREPRPCETDVHWEEVCIDIATSCHVFYAFKFVSPPSPDIDDDNDDVSTNFDDDYYFGLGKLTTEYHLFLDDDELHRDKITEEGQQAFFVGNCTAR